VVGRHAYGAPRLDPLDHLRQAASQWELSDALPSSNGFQNSDDGGAFDDDLADFKSNMNIETLHIGMKVRHPQYGVRIVKSLTGQAAEIAFDDAQRTIAPASSDLQPAEATATLSELEMLLANLIRDTTDVVVEALGLEQKDVLVEGLATRWQRGTLVMQPADSSLQPKISLPAVAGSRHSSTKSS
jgi:hypothetical protein